MAERRMLAKTIIDSDAFLDMPLSAQALYMHLNMRADDDGFINNPKRIQRMIGASEDDLKLLIAKSFILVFETGVIVIKHWRINNYIRNDRYKPTLYQEEKQQLEVKENDAYKFLGSQENDDDIPLVYQMDTQVRLGKDRLGKDNIIKHKHGTYNNVLLTDEEYQKLTDEYPNAEDIIEFLSGYIEEKNYKSKSHYLSIKRWVVDAVKEKSTKNASKVVYEYKGESNDTDLDEIAKKLFK